jgi:hypothetical protein
VHQEFIGMLRPDPVYIQLLIREVFQVCKSRLRRHRRVDAALFDDLDFHPVRDFLVVRIGISHLHAPAG